MKNKDTITKDQTSQAILREGQKSKFWELIIEALTESKQAIQNIQDGEDIAELSAEQYKFRNELFKAKKEFLDKLINTPDNIISWLETPNNERQDFDPYGK